MALGAVVAVLVVLVIVLVVFVFGGKKDKADGDITQNVVSSDVQNNGVQNGDEQNSDITADENVQPDETQSADSEDETQSDDTSATKDKKTKKKKTSVFARIKSLFTKTVPMEHTFPVMAFGRSIENEVTGIVSLSPMATEFIMSSPSQNALVAVSNYCNKYSFENLMTAGTPLLPNTDKIIQLDPDVVIVQTPLSDVDKVKLEQSGIMVLQMNAPESFDDVKEIYRSVTALTHGGEIASFESERVTADLQNRLNLYTKALEKVEKKNAVMVFNSYGMVATKDTFEADILSRFFNIAFDGRNYYSEDFASVAASNPQVIIASDYMTEADLINMGLGESEAFAGGNVYYVNIQQFESYSAKSIAKLCGIANSVYGDAITVQITAETAE